MLIVRLIETYQSFLFKEGSRQLSVSSKLYQEVITGRKLQPLYQYFY